MKLRLQNEILKKEIEVKNKNKEILKDLPNHVKLLDLYLCFRSIRDRFAVILLLLF